MSRGTTELPSVARRLAAGKLLMEGASDGEVAQALQISETTVRKYRQLMETGGIESLRKISVGGRASALDANALQWIANALRGSPRDHGFQAEIWTNSRLRQLIATRYGVTYSRVYAWQLATNLGLGHRLGKDKRERNT